MSAHATCACCWRQMYALRFDRRPNAASSPLPYVPKHEQDVGLEATQQRRASFEGRLGTQIVATWLASLAGLVEPTITTLTQLPTVQRIPRTDWPRHLMTPRRSQRLQR